MQWTMYDKILWFNYFYGTSHVLIDTAQMFWSSNISKYFWNKINNDYFIFAKFVHSDFPSRVGVMLLQKHPYIPKTVNV